MEYLALAILILMFTFDQLVTKKFNKPFTFLILPFIIVVTAYYIININGNYNELNISLLFIWIVALLPFFIISILFKKRSINNEFKHNQKKEYKIIYIICFIISIIFLFRAYSLISNSTYFYYAATDIFSLNMAAGIYEYLRSLLMILLISAIGLYKKTLFQTVSIILSIAVLSIFQIKGMLLLPLVGGILMYLNLNKKKIRIIYILFIPIFAYLSFYLLYSIPYLVKGEFNTIFSSDFIITNSNRISDFLFSGILGFNSSGVNTNVSSGLSTLLSPIANILRRITGEERSILFRLPYIISKSGATSNVGTFFGSIYMFTDYTSLLIYSTFLSIISMILHYFFSRTKNIWFISGYYHFLSILLFGWFEYYLWHQYVVTMFLWLILINIIEKTYNTIRRR